MGNTQRRMDMTQNIKLEQNYDTTTERVYSYELNLLRAYMAKKGQRPEIARKLKDFYAWRLANAK